MEPDIKNNLPDADEIREWIKANYETLLNIYSLSWYFNRLDKECQSLLTMWKMNIKE